MLLASGGALQAQLSASNNGPVSGSGSGVVDTTTATVTVTGGAPTYTYSAAYLSGDTVTILDGTTATPTFRRAGVIAPNNFSGVVRVTVTDSASRTVTTDISWQIFGV